MQNRIILENSPEKNAEIVKLLFSLKSTLRQLKNPCPESMELAELLASSEIKCDNINAMLSQLIGPKFRPIVAVKRRYESDEDRSDNWILGVIEYPDFPNDPEDVRLTIPFNWGHEFEE